jgi:hypothetical protein
VAFLYRMADASYDEVRIIDDSQRDWNTVENKSLLQATYEQVKPQLDSRRPHLHLPAAVHQQCRDAGRAGTCYPVPHGAHHH